MRFLCRCTFRLQRLYWWLRNVLFVTISLSDDETIVDEWVKEIISSQITLPTGSSVVIVITSLLTKLLGQETAKGPFGLRVKLPPFCHTRWRLHTVPFIAKRQAGKLWISIFLVFGVTRPGINSESIVLVADARFTWSLVCLIIPFLELPEL